MNWFPVDKHVRNDPKVQAVRGRFGKAGVGDLLALWSYVASEGSQADEGLGVQRDGKPLNLTIMATALEFPGVDELRTFLDYLAEIEHIDPDYWRDRGIVYLAAMNRRMEAYRKSKGRVSTGRPVGRPRKSGNSGKHPDGISPSGLSVSEEIRATDSTEPGEIPKEIASPGNSGNSGETPGKSGPAILILDPVPDLSLLPEEPLEDDSDPRKGTLTPARLVRLWNGLRDPGPKVLDLGKARRELYARAIKAKPNPEDWVQAIQYLNSAPWANACGEGTHANYRADLDYLAKPGNVTKALERLAAKALPGARPARHTGRVAPTGSAKAAIKARQDAEDADLRARGLLT